MQGARKDSLVLFIWFAQCCTVALGEISMARYSYSRLGTFRTCPLQYKFRYVDRVKPEVGPSIEAFMGSRVHDALEWLYDQVRNARTPTTEDVLVIFQREWGKDWSDDVRVIKEGLEAADYKAVGEQCVRTY